MTKPNPARPHRTAIATVACSVLLSLAGCAGAGADKPAQPPADAMPAADPADASNADRGKGVSAKVPQDLYPVMPAPTAPPASAMAAQAHAGLDADAGACSPGSAQRFVGQPASAANVEAARAAAAAGTVRVISPGQAVTMDYRPDRLNIDVDAQRVIIKLRCG